MAIVSGQTATGTLSAATTGTAVWGSNTTTGNTVVVFIFTNQVSGLSSVSSVTDTQGNLYQLVTTFNNIASGDVIEVFYSSNITGGTTPTVTINAVRSITGGIIAREYSGLAIRGSFDTAAGAVVNASSSPTSNSTPAATRAANEVVIGAMIYNSTTPTISLGTGYLNLTLLTGGGSTNLAIEDKIVAATGFQTATFGSTASSNGECCVVTFADTTEAQATVLKNYQFARAGDGMSVSEKIR